MRNPPTKAQLAHARAWPAFVTAGTELGCDGVNPELFFPEQGRIPRKALAICRGCPAQADCLAFALDTDQRFGVWGGTTEAQRRKLRAAR